MRNQEAARYARWAAATAGVIALVVAGVYAKRAIEAARARRSAPAVVPATVQQQSAEFKFTKMEQDRAIFTIRASTATRFKDEDRSLLEDVWITIYGRAGDRNDNIHTQECSYEPQSGEVRCQGQVEIDIQGANPASGKPADKELVVKTSNLSFNRDTGEASTPERVEFRSPQGEGHAVGVSYSTSTAMVRLEHDVTLEVMPANGGDRGASGHSNAGAADRMSGVPVTATGSSLEVRRNERRVVLNGPAVMKQGPRELSAETISIDLDATFHAQHVTAEGHPVVRSSEGGGKMDVSAEKFEGFLSEAGWVQRIVAAGNVSGNRKSLSKPSAKDATATDHISAARVEVAMSPEKNLVREITASGGVVLNSQQAGTARLLKTESLLVKFGAGAQPAQQKIESAETLAPATIETKAGDDTTELRAKKFVTQFGSSGKLEKLLGHSGVEVHREIGKGAPQVSSSAELVATFAANGEWDTLDQSGKVRFQQADRRASAERAKMIRATDLIALDGSPVISDAASRTTAGSVTIDQKSGDIKAIGNVVSTYLAAGSSAGAMNLGLGPAHISADSLSGSTASGHVVYLGRARLWQGESVLDAKQIEVWREDKKLAATGNVVAVFPQAASGPLGSGFGMAAGKSTASGDAASPAVASTPSRSKQNPTLWVIHAPSLTYWDEQSKARLEGGVAATSQQGELTSKTLDAYLGPAPAGGRAGPGSPSGAPLGTSSGVSGGRQLTRIVAQGAVVVRQGDRRGTAEEAVYTAADQKFVLSGGEPTISDANSDTTTGRSLTFFVANDTILIDSQEGTRTLTKHRVEK
ncbi:MAG: LPS export ABC transporter periplasmic protein LptC [Candidatus Acidiferrales bacterium]